jgi:hypothetical protein
MTSSMDTMADFMVNDWFLERVTGMRAQCRQYDLLQEYHRRISRIRNGLEANLTGTTIIYLGALTPRGGKCNFHLRLKTFDMYAGHWVTPNGRQSNAWDRELYDYSERQFVLELPPSRARLLCPLVHRLANGQQPVAKLLLEFLDLPWAPPPPIPRIRRGKRRAPPTAVVSEIRVFEPRALKRLRR